jgi:archaellum component FlaC
MSEEWMNRVEKKIDGLGRRIDGLGTGMDGLDRRMDGLDGRMHRLEVRIDGVEVRLDKFQDGQQKLGVEVEEQASNIRALAESFAGLNERMDRGFAEILTRLDDRALPLEAASRYFATKLGDREPRPPKRQRRKRH